MKRCLEGERWYSCEASRLYAMQTGMKIDSKTPECRKFLSKLMDQLEAMKKQFGDNEAITQEIVGSAHVENYALKMFLYADNEDRAGQFHKNMIKSFYTASLLIDVLTVFGELSEENAQHRKYARWKAAYIHNCLKNGETPQPGPIGMEGESFDVEREEAGSSSLHSGTTQPTSSSTYEANIPTSNYTGIHIPPGAHAPANTPAEVPHNTGVTSNTIQPAPQNIPLVDPSLYSAQSAVCETPLVLSVGTTEKSLAPSSMHPPFRGSPFDSRGLCQSSEILQICWQCFAI
ncbi:vacuolar protein sorting-associated protein VTA1 homolog isoform X2 [Egretta garzetta]|uniref:vacuolar protein sorting-associated protein VTA1 homolog isoform X2 n=1 Tax=Egretta garzetta TaxID=188379 RepID=UPI00163C78DD|nr:vacuolar protein sorting-associated protein VTA1 homolog isoform X2 [Egretta garzetta]